MNAIVNINEPNITVLQLPEETESLIKEHASDRQWHR